MPPQKLETGKNGMEWRNAAYLLNISVTRSISCSAAAIFSADDGWGRPNPNIDMVAVEIGLGGEFVTVFFRRELSDAACCCDRRSGASFFRWSLNQP